MFALLLLSPPEESDVGPELIVCYRHHPTPSLYCGGSSCNNKSIGFWIRFEALVRLTTSNMVTASTKYRLCWLLRCVPMCSSMWGSRILALMKIRSLIAFKCTEIPPCFTAGIYFPSQNLQRGSLAPKTGIPPIRSAKRRSLLL